MHFLDHLEQPAQRPIIAGRVVAARRKKQGLTYREVALLAGCSASYIYRLEHGEYIAPDSDKLCRIARALEVSPDLICAMFGVVPRDLQEWMQRSPAQATEALRKAQKRARVPRFRRDRGKKA